MDPTRRGFLLSCLYASGVAAGTAGRARAEPPIDTNREPMLDLHGELAEPVRIERLQLLRRGRQLYVRALDSGGAEGVAAANRHMLLLESLFERLVAPYFAGRDARDLEALVDGVYLHGQNYKLAGLPFWNCVGHVELSLLDLIGKRLGRPVWSLFGKRLRAEVPVYLASFNRETTPDNEVSWMQWRLEATGATACKLRIGGGMGRPADAIPGRTEALVPLARRRLGEEVTIYVDANGSYDVARAIEVGRMLEDHDVGFFEEPCAWQEYGRTRRVTRALNIPVAGGEQDTSLPRFRWIVQEGVLDIVQPDVRYVGGLVRSLRVARMAEARHIPITPHSPQAGPNAAGTLQLAALAPNLGPFVEYPGHAPLDGGRLKVPDGPGLGHAYAPHHWEEARLLCEVSAD